MSKYKFYGQFDPPVDKFLFEHYFCRGGYPQENGTFIECGAFDGQLENSCKFFEESLHWRGINVEACPPVYKRLVENRPNSLNVNVALSNEIGKATFTHAIHPQLGEQYGNGSLHHTKEHKKLLDEIGCTYKEYQVNVITYPELIRRGGLKHLDLFVLDVEGNEMNVIDSMKNFDILPEIFCVEVGHLNKIEMIRAVASLGYWYDRESFVNLFFVRRCLKTIYMG